MASKAVTVPLPENLPFINDWFVQSAQKVEDDRSAMDADVWPGMVGKDLIKSMSCLSPTTYSGLFEALRPTVYKKLILTPKDLEDVSVEKSAFLRELYLEDDDFEYFSHDQLKVWLLYSAKYPNDIDWRKVATLYNESPDDQRQAINDFLWDFRRLEIHSLLDQKGLDLPLPESLRSNRSRSVGGEEQLFCEMTQQWLRDDVFHSRFEVVYTQGFHAGVAGYAGTLQQAIAKAIAYVQSMDSQISLPEADMSEFIRKNTQLPVNGQVRINYEGKRVVAGDLSRTFNTLTDSSAAQLNKLSWGERQSGPFSEQYLRKALWSTEKLFGLQWSKVRHLEDDLGM